jgi:methyl-accepting chemotaxis protein
MTIKTKVSALVAINILFLLMASGFAIFQMNNIGNEVAGIAERGLPLVNLVSEISARQLEMEVLFERAGRYGALMLMDDHIKTKLQGNVGEFSELGANMEGLINKGVKLVEQAQLATVSASAKQEFGKVSNGLKAIEEHNHQFSQSAGEVFKMLMAGQVMQSEALVDQVSANAEKMAQELDGMMADIEGFTEQAALTAEHHEQTAIKVLIGLVVTVVLLSVAIVVWVVGSLRRSLDWGMQAMARISGGDLSQPVEVESGDEIGVMLKSLEKMRVELASLMKSINQSSMSLSASSEQLAAASEEASQSVYQQKQETDQLATAINQMAATVQEVAGNTGHAADAAQQAEKEAAHGQRAVRSTIESINQLAEDIGQSSTVISQLGQESDNIGMVLDVIRGIAEQTNLLALNAAIEAARAGEQGRGFAVVADEVRTLASRTHDSTQEIQTMIERLQAGARESVKMMEGSRKQMDASVRQAAEAGEVLETVLGAVGRITDMNTQIASAAEEQSAVTEEINRNIEVISDVADQNTVTSHQTAEASTELAQTASELKGMIARFRLA